jgi:hypothetical protein
VQLCGRLGLSLVLLSGLSWCKVLYHAGEVEVIASETAETIEFCVRAPKSVYAIIRVDRNQNGSVDSNVDTLYAVTLKEHICTAFLLVRPSGATTVCGKFYSEAQLMDVRHEHNRWEYTLSVPKRELSFASQSAWIAMTFWDEARRARWHFPREDFKTSIHIRYEVEGSRDH